MVIWKKTVFPNVFGQTFVKWFAYAIGPLSVVSCMSCLQRRMDQDDTWRAGRPQPWPHCVRLAPSSPFPKGAQPPKFSANICCGQMAGWIKMPLGRELGFGPSDIVLDGYPAPLPRKADRAPQFSAHVCCAQMAVWIKMPLVIMEVGLSPSHIVQDGDPASLPLPQKRGHNPPIFSPCLL